MRRHPGLRVLLLGLAVISIALVIDRMLFDHGWNWVPAIVLVTLVAVRAVLVERRDGR